jgi:hypothetical protein
VKFMLYAVDAAASVLAKTEVSCVGPAGEITCTFDANLRSSSVPIARLVIELRSAPGNVQRTSGLSSGLIKSIEESADVPARGLHFAVFEGINTGASINFHAANVIAGVPDSTNAFIASSSPLDAVYDYSIVNNMLLTFKHTYPRAFTGLGREAGALALKEWFELEGMQMAMMALSFGKIGRAFKTVGRIAKTARSVASKAADVAKPVLTEGGGLLIASGVGGAKGRALGGAMLTAAGGIDAAQRAGILQ